ncbi:MAG: hypothetical protein WCI71_09410, partial [Bacteroidota bacterium]
MRYNWLFFLVIVCFMPWRVGAQSDTEPPVIEVWRLWQPGDLTFRICIKVTDQGSGVNNSTVRLYCNKTPGWLNSWTEDFWEYPNYPDFYETVADGGFLVSINNGDQILWKIEASDNAGNTFHYPEDLPDRVQVCDPWEGPEWCRTSMLDLESLNDLKTFYYNLSYPGGACEAFSFKQDGDDIKVYNNTTIWYTMEVSPSSLNPLQGFSFLTPDLYMPKPKSGLIPLDLSYYMMDNSVKIPNATSVDQITVNIDRKSYDAIIKNVWDMVLVSVKPALGKIAPLDWDLIIKAVEMVINSRIALQNNPAQDVNSLTLKCCEKVFSNETKKVLAKQLANYFVAHHPELSFKTALGGAMKTVSGAWTLITGFYNRFSFLVDVCRFPNDQESFQLVKESPLSLVESTIPGTFDYTGNDSIFVDDTMTFNISISIPPNNQRPYFKLYPEIIIYSPLGETIETTYIPDYNYNPEGGINLSFAGLINENLGVPLNPAALNTGFGITIHNYPWTVSSRGYRYKASLRPYYMEVLLYQNGLPGINVNPFEPDKEIYSGKIPFYLYDTVSPVKPQFAQISRFVSSFNYGFVVNDTVIPDIRYYNVYRQLPGEPEYSLLIDTIPSLGKQLCFFTEQFDTPYGYISYKIQAVDMTGKVSPMSDPLLINPPEVSQITLSATPMSTHLFDTITVTAAIRDVSGNIIAGELIEFSSDNSGYFIGDVDNKVYSDTLGSATIAYFPTSAGQHYLSAHSYNGISAQLTNPVNVNGNVPPGFVVITQFEYWFDDNVTDTHSSYLLPGVNVEFDEIITATELVPGQHTFNYRFKDSNGRWSSPVSQPFFKNGDYGGSSCQVTQWQYW